MNGWLILYVLLVAAVVMLLAWLWQRRTRNAGVVDVVWAAGMAGSAVYYAVAANGAALPRSLVALLGGAWDCAWPGIWAGACSAMRTRTAATRICASTGTTTRASSCCSSWPRR